MRSPTSSAQANRQIAPTGTFHRKAAARYVVARQYRLREEHDVKRVRSRGRAVAQGPLVMRFMPNTLEPSQNRYTVIAGKRCGKAVQRNRLKRLVREALLPTGPDEHTVQSVSALLDFSTFKSFLDRDIQKEQAAKTMSEVILCWINASRRDR